METKNKKKTLDDIASVELPKKGIMKFILCEISDGENTKMVFVGNPKYGYHRDIAEWYKDNTLRPNGIRCNDISGGGKINITEHEIFAYGYSGSYGEAPQDEVEKVLEPYAENKKKKLTVKMGEGY